MLYVKNFSRPHSLACLESYLIVLCDGFVKRKFTFELDQVKGEIKNVLAVISSADFLVSGPQRTYFEISNSELRIRCRDAFDKLVVQIAIAKGEKVTAASYSCLHSLLFIGLSSRDGSRLDVHKIDEDFDIQLVGSWLIDVDSIGGLAASSPNLVLVCDELESNIFEFDLLTSMAKVIAKKGRKIGEVRWPGLAFFGVDGFLVCDRHNYRIVAFNPDGVMDGFVGEKGEESGSFDLPSCVDFSASLNGYLVADKNNDRISFFSGNFEESPSPIICRDFAHDSFCRPVSACAVGDKILVADRGNKSVAVCDSSLRISSRFGFGNGNWRPTEVVVSYVLSELRISVLYRGLGVDKRSKITSFSLDGNLLAEEIIHSALDAQGMVAIGDKFCVSDTLNRRAILLDAGFNILKVLDLAESSGDSRFLCRVPCLFGAEIWFICYETGLVVATTPDLESFRLVRIELQNFELKALRRVIKFNNNVLMLGRGYDSSDALICCHENFTAGFEPVDCGIQSPVDVVKTKNDRWIVVDKETDRLVDITDGLAIARNRLNATKK